MADRNTSGEHRDFNDIIESTGCREAYQIFEDCLIKNNRVMSKCQKEIKEFAACTQKQKSEMSHKK